MPAVRSASGPISVPACDAPISMGTPSRAMRGFFNVSASDIKRLRLPRADVPSSLEIRDLGSGREQPAVRRPQFAILVAVTLVKDFRVGHREHAAGILGGEIVRVGV